MSSIFSSGRLTGECKIDLKLIKGLILDADGVLWQGAREIGDLKQIFSEIDRCGLAAVIVSNNSILRPADVVGRLAGFGVPFNPAQVVTGPVVVAEHLRQLFPAGGRVFVVGEDPLIEALARAGFSETGNSEVCAVVVGLDRHLTYDKIKQASLHIQRGAIFLAVNADPSVPSNEGLVPGCGAILAAVEAASGASALVLGKPHPEMYALALSNMRLDPGQVVVVGDRIESDIVGAQRIGCRTALVLSGIYQGQDASSEPPAADLIAADLGEIVQAIVSQTHAS